MIMGKKNFKKKGGKTLREYDLVLRQVDLKESTYCSNSNPKRSILGLTWSDVFEGVRERTLQSSALELVR